MRHVTPLTIRCDKDACGHLYQIPISSNEARHELEIQFADCPHCRTARDSEALYEHWGEPRCWGCRIPFSLNKEEAMGLCSTCYLAKWKQKQIFLSKATKNSIM